MPYTKPEDREQIKALAQEMIQHVKSSGDLTYAITLLMHLETLKQKQSYTNMSRIRATAQDSADEYYRVVMAPYEDKKREENGPVSELDSWVDWIEYS